MQERVPSGLRARNQRFDGKPDGISKNKMNIHNVTANSGSTPIIIETGKLAKLADGAVTVRCGETIILVTAVSATKIKEGQDWFPLSVEYREKAAAVGRFPGGYF